MIEFCLLSFPAEISTLPTINQQYVINVTEPITTQPSNQQHKQSESIRISIIYLIPICTVLVIADESEYSDFMIMQGKLSSLVEKIQQRVVSAGIEFDDLKNILIQFYQFKTKIQRARNFKGVFNIVRKLCSPVNIEVLFLIVDHFKLYDVLFAIQEYENDEQNYCKKLLSSTFTQELKKETELLGRYPTPECTITIKLNWPSSDSLTVKEFQKVIKNMFSDYTRYIHICEVGEGCIFVTMCAPKPLMGALVKMVKIRLPYLLDIGVILLQIGNEIILNKSEKEVKT